MGDARRDGRGWSRGAAVLVLLVALGGGLALGAAAAPAPASRSAIYPAVVQPLRFEHGRHATIACLDCHPTARTSQSAVDRLLPGEAVCARCHPIDRAQPTRVVAGAPAAACIACHPSYQPEVPVAVAELPPPSLKFSHAAHADATCTRCHGDVTAGAGDHLPTMATCLGCHDDVRARSACATCHLTEIGGRLRTELPTGTLVPVATGTGVDGVAHDADFLARHGGVARDRGATCAACHEERYCTDCHVGTVPARGFHVPGYEQHHAAEARRGTPDCAACHRAQSFCVGCHERVGIGTRGGGPFIAGDPARQFHPVGWSSTSIAGPNLHAAEARRNLPSCASCHREDDCLTCHSAQPGAVRISPHPRGWRGSAQCEAMDRKNRRVCLRCHITADELGCDWTSLSPAP
ncbi:MAG: cytochrome c3 family protein [Kofleriaceae bacterium]